MGIIKPTKKQIKSIQILDNFFTEEEYDKLLQLSKTLPYEPAANKESHFSMRCFFKSNESEFNWINKKIKNTFLKGDNTTYYFLCYIFDQRHNKTQIKPHRDDSDWNFICYLSGQSLIYNGTGFWSKQINENKDNCELNTYVGFQKNRAIFFNGRDTVHGDLQALGESSIRITLSIFLYSDKKDCKQKEPLDWSIF